MNTRLPNQMQPISPAKAQTIQEIQKASDGFKTYMQQRDANLVKPRNMKPSMWDMLALKQALANKNEDLIEKHNQVRQKVQMK